MKDLQWAAGWIEESAKLSGNPAVIEFAANMAMTLRSQSAVSHVSPKAVGVSRMVDSEAPKLADKMVLVSFERRPTDDELRALHDLLAGRIPSARGESRG